MQRRTFIKVTGAAGIITLISPTAFNAVLAQKLGVDLKELFLNPPPSALPQVYWFWMNGNVSKEGITLDLEAMKRAGIGGVFNFDVGGYIPKGPVVYLSAEWLQLKQHAINEAHRLGLQYTMHNCPGWSSSGGPWITSDKAMQGITWSETYVEGGSLLNIQLLQPTTRLNYYKDVAVLAFPSLQGEAPLTSLLLSASTEDGLVNINALTDDHAIGVTVTPKSKGSNTYLQFQFKDPYEVRFLSFEISSLDKVNEGEEGTKTAVWLAASNNGDQYKMITEINTGFAQDLVKGNKFITYDIPVTKASYFRIISNGIRRYEKVRFSGVDRYKNWMEKGAYRFMFDSEHVSDLYAENEQVIAASSIIQKEAIIDLSSQMNEEGLLNWNAPTGTWTILRIGYTPMGTLISAAPDGGAGLEVDKLNADAFDFHFYQMMTPLLPLFTTLERKGKVGLEIDSYEAGVQNWTANLPQAFKDFRGYDILHYLPLLTGRTVNGVEESSRFLWDFRNTIAQLMASNYYSRFAELCKKHNIVSYIQPYDRGPFEEMQIGAAVDVNVAEFWSGPSTIFQKNHLPLYRTPRLAASIAQSAAQKIVAAEAFSAEPGSGKWQSYPFALKALGDHHFTLGINQFILHRFAHQPHSTAAPGMTMGPWGSHFDRTNTWWEMSKSWFQYLARCQTLLQQGQTVVDIAYFSGEDSNLFTRALPHEIYPTPPDGYHYHLINAETIVNKVAIVNGAMLLPRGASYKILVLQKYKAITVKLLKKLVQLVREGLILVGYKPEKSLGLNDENKEEFNALTHALWGAIDGKFITENTLGKGFVIWGMSLQRVLKKFGVSPDFQVSSLSGDAPISAIHKRVNNTDIYFVSNERRTYENIVCTFRVQNKKPQIWNALTGNITSIKVYEIIEDTIRIPLQLEPSGSRFILFNQKVETPSIVSILQGKKPILSTALFPTISQSLYKTVFNNFTITFWAKPEMDIMLEPAVFTEKVAVPWTTYFVIYPPEGEELYGSGHAACGLTVGRNGVAVWVRSSGNPTLAFAAAVPISGWAYIGLVYKNGIPIIYVNGNAIGKGKSSNTVMHPGIGKAFLTDGATYFNGDMSEPQLFEKAFNEIQMKRESQLKIPVQNNEIKIVEEASNEVPQLLFRKNGNYSVQFNNGETIAFRIDEINKPTELGGAWRVTFPPNSGAPAQIILPRLMSLHLYKANGVKYFSGTAEYSKSFFLKNEFLGYNKRIFLNLGNVEVIAEIFLNNTNLGILWARPFEIDITDLVKEGLNHLVVKVANLWPNRFIGDQQLSDNGQYTLIAETNGLAALTGGAILSLPDWYVKNSLKPADESVAFSTWKPYSKHSPLLQSGLLGPVVLYTAVCKSIPDKS